MAKELYLYSPVMDFVAEALIASIDENMGEEVNLRVNSPGGSVFANYGICAKMMEHGSVNCIVDGAAMSSAANLLPYAKKVTCLDVSTFVLHRADMYVETEADKQFLARINKDLKAKLLLKVDSEVFLKVTGVSIDEMFASETRIDVTLSAKQAKQIGLVDSITKLTPAQVEAFNNKMFAVAATNTQKPKTMNIETLKAEHPAVYNAIFALGVTEGTNKEKDRVGAYLAFVELDAKAVKEAIASGVIMTETSRSEFAVKAMSAKALADVTADGTKSPLKTKEELEVEAKTEKEKEVLAFSKLVDASLGLNKTV